MNSLGAGGEEKPYLVNGANALTFCLMVISCFFSPILVRRVGIKWALIFGTMGYAPFAAGLYTNNRFGTEWFVLFGAALCGISAGVFCKYQFFGGLFPLPTVSRAIAMQPVLQIHS
jgi:hypothetical protein